MRLILSTTVVAAIVFVLAGGGYMWGAQASRHDCNAPCYVHFSKPMAEDNFGIDYYDGQLQVFKVAPDWVED
jgi:hypothetical protein